MPKSGHTAQSPNAAESSNAGSVRHHEEDKSSAASKRGAIKHQIELEIQESVRKQQADIQSEGEKEADVLKVEEGEKPPMRRRGMALGYIPPTLKEVIPTAQLRSTELENEANKWRNAVVLYVIGDTPTIGYLKRFLQEQCGIVGGSEIFYHNEGYFVIRFELKTDKDRMLFEGPYMLGNIPIIIKEWVADFCFEKEVLKEIPLWIRLPKLPLNCWSVNSLSRIGSVIGTPICADECTSQQQRISYARLLVEVDITKPLLYKVQIEGEAGVKVEQQVCYEWVPLFCHKCHKVGHICRDKEEGVKPKQKQQWLRKDKGKEVVVDEEWQQPKKVSTPSIQVGNIEITTKNAYEELGNNEEGEGGDLFPMGGT